MRSLNSTVESKKYNIEIELLSGVSQRKTYSWSQRISPHILDVMLWPPKMKAAMPQIARIRKRKICQLWKNWRSGEIVQWWPTWRTFLSWLGFLVYSIFHWSFLQHITLKCRNIYDSWVFVSGLCLLYTVITHWSSQVWRF
jgi:hypothetical protein